jgi:hypothetical protein
VAIDYRLTLAGETPIEEVVERAVPGLATTGETPRTGFDLYKDSGFLLAVTSGRNGYFDAEGDDDEYWEWAPASYVNVGFRMDKDRLEEATQNMLSVVARILSTGPEDAALVLDGNALLLTRTDGIIRKHRKATWWDQKGNEIIHEG